MPKLVRVPLLRTVIRVDLARSTADEMATTTSALHITASVAHVMTAGAIGNRFAVLFGWCKFEEIATAAG